MSFDRYGNDVLAAGWQQRTKPKPVSTPTPMEVGMVVEESLSDFCGAIVRWENGLVVLEDCRGKQRSFPVGAGFLLEGKPVELKVPPRTNKLPTHTASGSRIGPTQAARQALPSRIYVEGRHDAELVEKIWGDDLRHVGVVVEYMGGIDDLPEIIASFAPEKGRRLGVLVDHLVPGSKESRIVEKVAKGPYAEWVFVTGHDYIDIWAAIKPERVGLRAWPQISRDAEWKHGICEVLQLPHQEQADIARVWQAILARVRSWKDLDAKLLTEVEKLIDFVTQDHNQG
ncbi:MAG: DUF3097 domain-containing protein [Propionibacteriaceae bacterium]